jgi:hypothetical protein
MKDFSYKVYRHLIDELKQHGYQFQTFESYLSEPLPKSVLIRHDIDLYASKALPFIRIEREMGVTASYYFRVIKGTFKPEVFKEAVASGHELGYHYEDLARNAGDITKALGDFKSNLELFKKYYSVHTVCMHGSSGSHIDNRDMWLSCKFEDYGLIGEPYVSLDFNKVLYLSDTSKRWNGSKIALRDKVKSQFTFSFTSTWDIINNMDKLPNHIMLTIHPEYWADSFWERAAVDAFVIIHSYYKKYYRNRRSLRKAQDTVTKLVKEA